MKAEVIKRDGRHLYYKVEGMQQHFRQTVSGEFTLPPTFETDSKGLPLKSSFVLKSTGKPVTERNIKNAYVDQ